MLVFWEFESSYHKWCLVLGFLFGPACASYKTKTSKLSFLQKPRCVFGFLQRQTNISTKVLKNTTTKLCCNFFCSFPPPFLCLPAFLYHSTCLLVKSSLGPHSCRQTKTFLTVKESPEVKFTQIVSSLLPNLFGLFLNTIKW